jgi:hypothetical protein
MHRDFEQHWYDAFHGMGHQLLLVKGVAQGVLCAGCASSEIPQDGVLLRRTVSCCAYVLCLVEY